MNRLWVSSTIAACLCACPPPVMPGDDGGTLDSGTTITDGCLVAPALPEAPRLADWSCPPGWEPLPVHDVSAVELANGYPPAINACAPPALPASCPVGQRVALGSASCQPVGDPCPAGDFPPTPAGAVLFVKAGAAGDGSSAGSPLGTISQALTLAAPGTTIAIAKGTYVEHLGVNKAVTLLGACAQQTIVTAPSRASILGTVDLTAAATLKNLQIGGPRPGIWVLNTPDFAVLHGVVVRNAELVGVFVTDNGKVQLDDVLIQETLADPADGALGRGLQLRTGGKARGTGLVVEKNRDVGITLDGAGITADLADVVVRDTQSETASKGYGMGLEVRYGASAVLTRALFERNRNSAAVSDKPGSKLTLNDAVLQDTLPQENNNQYGGGLDIAAGVTLELNRVVIRRTRAGAIRLGGATATATDLVITDTEGRASDGTQGLGLVIDTQAQVDVTRAVFANNRVADLLVSDRGTRLTLTDARLRGARSQASNGKWGMGFVAVTEATFTATRVAIEHTDDSGGQVQGKAVATLTDLSVRDTGFGGPATSGDGLAVQSTAQATVLRAAFQGNRRIGAGAHDGAVMQLTDVTVREVGTDLQGYFGRAVVAQTGAIVSILRGQFVRAREAALYSWGVGTRLYVEQASVLDTQATTTTAEHEGRAASVEAGSVAEFTCFLAQGNREVAVNINGAGSALTLKRGRLVDTVGVQAFGDGVAASQGATAVLEDCEVQSNQNLGVAFAGAQGILRRVRVITNTIGLYAGEGSTSREVAEAGAIAPLEVQVEQSCSFENNQTRVAGDFVPVPGAVDATPSRPEFQAP